MTIRRSYIDNKAGGQIHLTEKGSGPAVLLIHQTPRSWDEFREVLEICGDEYRLVAMDLPGMGASSPVEGTPSIEAYADAAEQVAAHIGDDAITVCGHHTGGVVAIELAARRPDLVSSLILSSTPWIDAAVRAERATKTPIDSVPDAPDGSHLQARWDERAPYYPGSGDYLNRCLKDALRAEDSAAGHNAVSAYHMENAAAKIDCPVLLVEHGKDPFAVKHTEHLRIAFTDAELKKIENGHVALEVTAGAFAEILNDWMRRQHPLAKEQERRTG